MESRDGNEHDRVRKRRKDMLCNDNEEIPRIDTVGREDDHGDLGNDGCNQAAHETPTPETHRRVCRRPFPCIVT